MLLHRLQQSNHHGFLCRLRLFDRGSYGHQSGLNVTTIKDVPPIKYRHHLLPALVAALQGCSADFASDKIVADKSSPSNILHHGCCQGHGEVHPTRIKAPSSFPASSGTVAAVVNGLPPTMSAKTNRIICCQF